MNYYFQPYPAYCQTPYAYNIYWQYPYYYSPIYDPQYQYANNRQSLPDVDVSIFSESLRTYKQMLRDASTVLDHLADSKKFATEVMSAAQASKTEEVERLIQSIGITSDFKVTYNPQGIHFKFWSLVEETECCKLDMAIRWR